MKSIHFILAVESPVIRVGLISVISRISSPTEFKEIGTVQKLGKTLAIYNPQILIFSPGFFPANRESVLIKYKNDFPSLIVIALTDNSVPENLKTIVNDTISLNDTKEDIQKKIMHFISSGLVKIPETNHSGELSERETTILKQVALGLTNKEISEKLFISTHTVITHRKNITAKLGIKTIAGLTMYAVLNRIVTHDEIR
jgi:DNA-binding NarL/FixJ family response regulator